LWINGTLLGATAPILGYGALNGLLYYTYNRSLLLLGESRQNPESLPKIWAAGAIGGFASFLISSPTELIKCRAQVSLSSQGSSSSSWTIAKDIFTNPNYGGIRGLYFGGGVTSVRDAVGYGFYFWSYEVSKRYLHVGSAEDTARTAGMKILLAGGIAGVVTWASIFPLDVIKTRVQTQPFSAPPPETSPLLPMEESAQRKPFRRKGAVEMARLAYTNEGLGVFFRGLGVCSVRAFVVNAVQWAVYEWMMRVLAGQSVQEPKVGVEVGAL
jgi:solute carrier family 25 carnitine/acylcarnitine transporter 20/29